MYLSAVHIDRFGSLAKFGMEGFRPGLNVVYGPNGSGKSTLLHFLRSVFLGFEDARKMQFVPTPDCSAAREESGGGSLTLVDGSRTIGIVRTIRPRHEDHLAVRVQGGDDLDATKIRRSIQSLPRGVWKHLFAVGAGESHAVVALLEQAHRDGIAIDPAITIREPHLARLESLRERQMRLCVSGSIAVADSEVCDVEELLARLDERRVEMAEQLEQARIAVHARYRSLHEREQSFQHEVDSCRCRVEQSHADLQSLQADLREAEDRLWRREGLVRRAGDPILMAANACGGAGAPGPAESSAAEEIVSREWPSTVSASEVARLREVLRDLAADRYRLSCALAVSATVPGRRAVSDEAAYLEREAFSRLMLHLLRCRAELHREASRTDNGGQQEWWHQRASSLEAALDCLHDLQGIRSFPVNGPSWNELREELDSLDRCEREVQLRLRTLLERCRSSHADTGGEPLRHQNHSVRPLEPPLDVSSSEELQSLRSRVADLGQKVRAAWEHHQRCLETWTMAARRCHRVRSERLALAEDDGLNDLRIQWQELDQEWHRLREDWQALCLAEQALTRSRTTERVETPSPVMQRATEAFHRLTHGRYRELRWDREARCLFAVDQSGESLDLDSLSRGTLDQVALSVRMALIQEYVRRGVRWPVVLDETLADCDLDRVRSAAELIQSTIGQAGQVLYLTCLDHVVDVLASVGAAVHVLPGHTRLRLDAGHPRPGAPHWLTWRETQTPRMTAPLVHPSERPANRAPAEVPAAELLQTRHGQRRTPRQPGDRYWLRADSSLSLIPSLGAQMARRLGALGVQSVADLILLDPECSDIPFESQQVNRQQLRIWQAEARLLLCLPRLTGRDAQFLVSIGLLDSGELSRESALSLMKRIDRMRGESLDRGITLDRPTHAEVRRWIESAQAARTVEEACRETGGRPGTPRQSITIEPSFSGDVPVKTSSPVPSATAPTLTAGEAGHAAAREPDQSEMAGNGPREASVEWRFYLDPESPVVDAPSIGPTTANRLARIGVNTVRDLLTRDPAGLAEKLGQRGVTSEVVLIWKHQARLMLRIPRLRRHDAQVLVACGICDPETLAGYDPRALWAKVGPFVATREAQRLLRSARTPDLEEVREWIHWAQHARALKAA